MASIRLTCFQGLLVQSHPECLNCSSLAACPESPSCRPSCSFCSNCISISSKLKVPPFCSFSPFFGFFFVDFTFNFFDQRKDVTHTKIRCATRSGWNGSSASSFSPIPKNLIGFTCNRTNRKCSTTTCITIRFGQESHPLKATHH